MVWFAMTLLIVWPVLVFFIFERQSTRQAIVTSFVAAWLFLPPLQLPLPGVPDWSKTSATVVGVLGTLLLKQPGRILAFRPRWFDLPVLAYSVCSFPSALTMGMGAYEGLSSVLNATLWWGVPYLIGRVYLADLLGGQCLARAVAMGGLLYAPLCLVEIRLSPILKSWVYGVSDNRAVDFGLRYGGYRPTVFMSTGLEVGWWMCCASLCAYLLVASRDTRRWFSLPAAPLLWALLVVTLACKATGAILQISLGFLLIRGSRTVKSPLPLALLLLIAPAYCLSRPSGYCSGQQISSFFSQIFPADRIQSLDYRFMMEDRLIEVAWQHPILGWSRNGGFNPIDEYGNPAAVTDGYWIVVFCSEGYVGLTLLNVMLLLPTGLFLRRFPVRTWATPEVAPLVGLATILPLFLIDNLSNAMLNPIYALTMGLISGALPNRRTQERFGHDWTSDQAVDQQLDEAIAQQARLVRSRPHGRNVGQLALLHAQRAQELTARGRVDLALSERSVAEDLWRSVGTSSVGLQATDRDRAVNANDLAWLLTNEPGVAAEFLVRAGELSEFALAVDPNSAPFWNTLGLVRYRQGDYLRSIHALSRSVSLEPNGGTAFDFYLLALANQALGYEPMAATWLDRAESWWRSHPEMHPALAPLRDEIIPTDDRT